MSTQPQLIDKPSLTYPDSDGRPMADNTIQFRWIVTLQGGFDAMFRDDPAVCVAGDLLWYPVEGDNTLRSAPDVMVVFGRPKGDRGSYRQWEEGDIAPQVVFEIVSPGNRFGEMVRKFRFYDRFGIEEFYSYDPDGAELTGWLRDGDHLQEIEKMDGWVSPRLGVRFDMSAGELRIFRPDGQPFVTFVELAQRSEAERQRAERLAAQLRALGFDPEP
jgi:Uma2 family endonuclease